MSKLTKQNVDGVDFSMVGCALTGTCFSAASDFIKVVNLTDGDVITDGMSVVVTFAQANTAGNAPAGQTVYSSDQITYYYDAGLTNPVTLPPAGCYHVRYTGTGNAYTLYTYPVITAGGVTAPLYMSDGSLAGGILWSAGANVIVLYSGGKFIISNSVGKADIQDLGNYDNVASSVEDAMTRAFNAITITGKTVVGYFVYAGTFMCLAFKYNGGQYGSMLIVRNDGIAWTLTCNAGTSVVSSLNNISQLRSATPVPARFTGPNNSCYYWKYGKMVYVQFYTDGMLSKVGNTEPCFTGLPYPISGTVPMAVTSWAGQLMYNTVIMIDNAGRVIPRGNASNSYTDDTVAGEASLVYFTNQA